MARRFAGIRWLEPWYFTQIKANLSLVIDYKNRRGARYPISLGDLVAIEQEREIVAGILNDQVAQKSRTVVCC